MRKTGIHLSYWCTNWNEHILPLLVKAKKAGFDGAELPLLDFEVLNLSDIKHEADRLELDLTCCTGLSAEKDISHPDSQRRQKGMEHLLRCIQGASLVNSPVLAGIIYEGWGARPPVSGKDICYQNSVESLKKVAEEVEKNGVILCLELLNRYEGYLLNTVEQGLQFIRDIGSPYVKLHLDTYHMNIEEDNLPAAIIMCGDSLGHLHCSENNRKRPGLGHIPWKEIRTALDKVAYEGWVVMECFLQNKGKVGKGTYTHRPLTSNLDDDANRGASFLKSIFA